MAVYLLAMGTILFVLVGLLLIHLANKPTPQSKAYYKWLRNERRFRRAINQSWKEGNW